MKALWGVAATAALAGALSGCFGLSKRDSVGGPTGVVAGFAQVSQCATFELFRSSVIPAYQSTCLVCHAAGGLGAANFTLSNGASDDDVASDFIKSKAKLVPVNGGGGPIDSTLPLLGRIGDGAFTHPIKLGTTSVTYLTIRDWADLEYFGPCVIDPTTGEVTNEEYSGF